jgi:hypothetical protein
MRSQASTNYATSYQRFQGKADPTIRSTAKKFPPETTSVTCIAREGFCLSLTHVMHVWHAE